MSKGRNKSSGGMRPRKPPKSPRLLHQMKLEAERHEIKARVFKTYETIAEAINANRKKAGE